jgi:hypothetical protein
MANNIDRDGEKALHLSLAPGVPAAPLAGQPFRLGGLTGVALTNHGEDVPGKVTVMVGFFIGNFAVTETASTGIDVGDTVYFVDTAVGTPATRLTNNPAGMPYGIAMDPVLSGATTEIRVWHAPVFS